MKFIVERLTAARGSQALEYSFSLAQGARLGVVGEAGSGKSSLLHMIAGFERPLRGALWWGGLPFHGLLPHERPVTLLFPRDNLFDRLSLWENVALGLNGTLTLNRSQKERVYEVLHQFGILEMAYKTPTQVTLFQQHKTAIARNLLRGKEIFLFDDPFEGLLPWEQAEMALLLCRFCTGREKILMVTGRQEETLSMITKNTLLLKNRPGGLREEDEPYFLSC